MEFWWVIFRLILVIDGRDVSEIALQRTSLDISTNNFHKVMDAMTHFITFITPNYADRLFHMMTSWNGNVFRVTGLLWGESTGHRWIPLTKDQ